MLSKRCPKMQTAGSPCGHHLIGFRGHPPQVCSDIRPAIRQLRPSASSSPRPFQTGGRRHNLAQPVSQPPPSNKRLSGRQSYGGCHGLDVEAQVRHIPPRSRKPDTKPINHRASAAMPLDQGQSAHAILALNQGPRARQIWPLALCVVLGLDQPINLALTRFAPLRCNLKIIAGSDFAEVHRAAQSSGQFPDADTQPQSPCARHGSHRAQMTMLIAKSSQRGASGSHPPDAPARGADFALKPKVRRGMILAPS